MQCMMKEVCAQCLQKHVDPATGREKEIVFSCFNQDQLLDEMDWENLAARLRQNTVSEKLTNLWLDRLLSTSQIPRDLPPEPWLAANANGDPRKGSGLRGAGGPTATTRTTRLRREPFAGGSREG